MFSIIMPMDTGRLEQFLVTKRAYDEMSQKKEFIIPTRSTKELEKFFTKHKLWNDVRLAPYEFSPGFNPSMAFNIGVRLAKYDSIIITSPEVKPAPDVLDKLEQRLGDNVVCLVSDQDGEGNLTQLVNKTYRSDTPAMYFLALFNKSDIEKINGWDEEFMKGYAYEDNDFGARWVRAGLPYSVSEDIQAVHQYHPRTETIHGGSNINMLKFEENTANNVTWCENGLIKGKK